MNNPHLVFALFAVWVALLLPLITFVAVGWKVRKDDIVNGFSTAAIVAYFRAFHPQKTVSAGDAAQEFERYYSTQYGRRRFVLPGILFAAVSGLLLCWSTLSVPDLLAAHTITAGRFPTIGISAVMGAYMWVLSDEIGKWYSGSLSPAYLYWWSFRFIVAVPMAYALSAIFASAVAVPFAFLLGAFPTNQLLKLCRRAAAKSMQFTESDNGKISEVQNLQGIDVRYAEQLVDEQIT